ncbi:hypothetical protein COL940_009265 [Colletotrichum noveboracense]|nr:hypothetical protein COL940_009265 [Colletotrichum noveboracense]
MPPPPIPRSRMTPPKARSSQAPSPQELSPQRPPPSTQAIIQDCFDDVFPTASQLALELEDDEPAWKIVYQSERNGMFRPGR